MPIFLDPHLKASDCGIAESFKLLLQLRKWKMAQKNIQMDEYRERLTDDSQ